MNADNDGNGERNVKFMNRPLKLSYLEEFLGGDHSNIFKLQPFFNGNEKETHTQNKNP